MLYVFQCCSVTYKAGFLPCQSIQERVAEQTQRGGCQGHSGLGAGVLLLAEVRAPRVHVHFVRVLEVAWTLHVRILMLQRGAMQPLQLLQYTCEAGAGEGVLETIGMQTTNHLQHMQQAISQAPLGMWGNAFALVLTINHAT
jgi:hypothetical protein